VANALTNAVTVINLATNTPAASTIAVGSTPTGVSVDAADGTVFVANQGSNTVSVISLTTGQVVATIVVP
jgi:YVTN family beta-propeller protein